MKTIAPFCLLALVASFPACIDDASADSVAANPAGSKTTSKPTNPVAATPDATIETAEIGHVDGAAAAKLLKEDPSITILDIRTPDEFTAGHISGAVNIDFNDKGFAAQIKALDTSKRYLVHCKSGGRSGKSLAKFSELGFTKIVHLDDGFDGWKAAGHPVLK